MTTGLLQGECQAQGHAVHMQKASVSQLAAACDAAAAPTACKASGPMPYCCLLPASPHPPSGLHVEQSHVHARWHSQGPLRAGRQGCQLLHTGGKAQETQACGEQTPRRPLSCLLLCRLHQEAVEAGAAAGQALEHACSARRRAASASPCCWLSASWARAAEAPP